MRRRPENIVAGGGAFISFEGIDGSGKSTQARKLSEALSMRGQDVVLTREPGGSPGAEEIRALVLTGEPDRWSPVTEALLFTAARRDHLERVIEPALARGAVVVCDRFADSTRVYQGATRGDMREMVEALHRLAVKREPDLTVLIDMDPKVGLTRAKARRGREERFEDFGLEMQVAMRARFLELAESRADRFMIIDGTGAEDQVATEVLTKVSERLADI
ncbi:MAG: dTMP kinase [Pseudomonadota bacterium]